MTNNNKLPIPLLINKLPRAIKKSQQSTRFLNKLKTSDTLSMSYSDDDLTYDSSYYSSSDDFISGGTSPKNIKSQKTQILMPALNILTQYDKDDISHPPVTLNIPICNAQNITLSLPAEVPSKLNESDVSSSTYDSESYDATSSTQNVSGSDPKPPERQKIIKESNLNDDDVVSQNSSENDDISMNDITIVKNDFCLPVYEQNNTVSEGENGTPPLVLALDSFGSRDTPKPNDIQTDAKNTHQNNAPRPFSLDLQRISTQSESVVPQTARGVKTSLQATREPLISQTSQTNSINISLNLNTNSESTPLTNTFEPPPVAPEKGLGNLLALPRLIVPGHIDDDIQEPGAPALETRQIKQQKLAEMSGLLCQITDFLYLSGLEAAKQPKLLKQKKITHVINLCGDVCTKAVCHRIKYLNFNVKDSVTESLSDLFYHCASFIEQARTSGGRALVHCHQGVSRSATVIIAYLMFCNNLEFIDAFAHVRSCRPIAQPNTGFVFQITEFYRVRHMTLIRQMTSAQIIKEKLFIKQLIQRKKVIGKDAVLRDLNKFAANRYRAIKGTLPVVFYLDQISQNQPVMLFRLDQAFMRKLQQRYDRNVKRNRIGIRQPILMGGNAGNQEGQIDTSYKFDSSKLYVITNLPIGTVILIGKKFNRQTEDQQVMVVNKQYQEMLQDVDTKHLKKPNQFHLMNKKFRGGDTFKKQIDILFSGFSSDVKRHVILFLTELLYFENIHTNLLFYEQLDIENRYEELCNEQIFQYLMAKLLFFDARINNDWEHLCERNRLQDPDLSPVTNEQLNESGFYLFSNCSITDIFAERAP